jgi:transposase
MNMTNLSPSFIGVDVASAHLDIALHPQDFHFRIPNNEAGIEDCLKRLQGLSIRAVAMEATGGMERLAASRFQAAGYEVHVLNPRRICNWRQVVAKQAKTDRIDALLIAQFAATVPLRQTHVVTNQQRTLRDLSARREQIVISITNSKKQLARAIVPAIRQSIERQIAFATQESKVIEREMDAIFAADAGLRRQQELLESIPGIGKLSAMLILAELPEITFLPPKKLASLVGVAPHPLHSGTKTTKARITGGRPRIRTKCYMMAHGAINHNPWMRTYAHRLLARGKSRREVNIACINKLLHAAHAVLIRDEPWQPQPPMQKKT